MQLIENTPNSVVDTKYNSVIQCDAMKKRQSKTELIGFRAKPQDKAIIQAGQNKHGLDRSQIIRMALRRFAEAEGIRVAS